MSNFLRIYSLIDIYRTENNGVYPDKLSDIKNEGTPILSDRLIVCPIAERKNLTNKFLVYVKPTDKSIPTDILVYTPAPLYEQDGKKGYMVLRKNKTMEFVEESKFKKPAPAHPAPAHPGKSQVTE
jgi:hypothetical protein